MLKSTQDPSGPPEVVKIPFYGVGRKLRARQIAALLIGAGCLPSVVFSVDYKIDRVFAAVDILTKVTFYVRILNWKSDPLGAEWTTEPEVMHRKLRSRADKALLHHLTDAGSRPLTLELPTEIYASRLSSAS